MSNLKVVAAIIGAMTVAFVLGVAASPAVVGFGRLFQGSISVRCVGHDACVSDSAETFLESRDLEDEIGGLSGVFCGGDWLFLADILGGSTCSMPSYTLEFRNRTTRTLVSIEGNSVREIEQGPLHTLDF